jgi:inner membrane protein
MEPVTHILTGACLARTGLNRRAAYTTLAMAVGAELPDIDTVSSFAGPIAGFEHHRGITHTFVALPFEAALVVLAIYAFHRWRQRRGKPATAAPVNWPLLFGFTLLALLSHLLLDFTNNYGIRPFFPFNTHWYAASIVFIFDPLMFLLLLGALVMPLLFRLIGSEVGARRQPFVARGWSVAALLLILALWTTREVQHNRAVNLAMSETYVQRPAPDPSAGAQANVAAGIGDGQTEAAPAPTEAAPTYLQAQRVLASPDPLSIFRWYTVTDYGPLYQLGVADTAGPEYDASQAAQPKLGPSPAWTAAESSWLGRVYLDWSPMPFITIAPSSRLGLDDDARRATLGHSVVTFADPRFMGNSPILHWSGHTPLTGKVELDSTNQVVAEEMDGKPQSLHHRD